MRRTGAALVVWALEQVGVRSAFGIPGVHTTELYDELANSASITPVLVTHEQAATFMADAVSRTCETEQIGCVVLVPGAGVTHALSGIAEAFVDGIPMLVLAGGIPREPAHAFRLHDIDQAKLVASVTKATLRAEHHEQVVPVIYQAYQTAVGGEPGPVFVELPSDLLVRTADVATPPQFSPATDAPLLDPGALRRAVDVLRHARQPGLYVGWGCRDLDTGLAELAELLGAPVATTVQGISVFPGNHPLHAGMGFGPAAVPAAERAFADVDALLAIGVRFAELATGGYSMPVPSTLVHIDINPEVFQRNYRASVTLEGDARDVVPALLRELRAAGQTPPDRTALRAALAQEKQTFQARWTEPLRDDRVSPGVFFHRLRCRLRDSAFLVTDEGSHTLLAAEQFPVHLSRRFLSPTDFNCMGYGVPAAIATKLSHPDEQVVAVVGDGGFAMSALEIATATHLRLGVLFCVFRDGELGSVAEHQRMPHHRKTCTVLPALSIEGIAQATGALYVPLQCDTDVDDALERALQIAGDGQPVILDVRIDYGRRSAFTSGVLKVHLDRFPLREKLRMLGRAAVRRVTG